MGPKTQKRDYKDKKLNLHSFKWLKRAIGLNTCFDMTFDKLLVFVHQKYHTLDTLRAKTQKGDYKDQKSNLRSFKWLNEQLGLKLVLVGHLTNVWCLMTKSTILEILWAPKHKKEITKIKNQTSVPLSG